MDLDIIP